MATVETERDTGSSGGGGTGRVVRIIGPVVDVEFAPDEMPAINNSLTVQRTLGNDQTLSTHDGAPHTADEMPAIHNSLTVERTLGNDKTIITCEVALHIGDAMVRAIAMSPTDGLVRGAPVSDTGPPMSSTVGD